MEALLSFVFASFSLGKEGLYDLLQDASNNPGTQVVFRGIREGQAFSKGIFEIQNIAKQFDPIPHVVINPTLFTKHNVTYVPTVILIDTDAPSDFTQALGAREVSRVSGLSNSDWLIREQGNGRVGNFGIKGPIEEISERSLIDVAKERFAAIDWDEKKAKAVKNFWKKQPFTEMPVVSKSATKKVDPSIFLTDNIMDGRGKVLVAKGTVINPLHIKEFKKAMFIFNPLDKRQVDSIRNEIAQLPSPQRNNLLFIATQFDRSDGWDSYTKITDTFDAPVYLLTTELRDRFQITNVPSLVTADSEVFYVKHLNLPDLTEPTGFTTEGVIK